jgi:hypothetical protein
MISSRIRPREQNFVLDSGTRVHNSNFEKWWVCMQKDLDSHFVSLKYFCYLKMPLNNEGNGTGTSDIPIYRYFKIM